MIQSQKFFSIKVATGDVFCNREDETKEVIRCIENNEHLVIVAPRRYGKTSLILKSIGLTNQAFALTDLFCSVYQEEVIRKIAKSVTTITRQFMSTLDKHKQSVMKFVEGVFRSSIIQFSAGGLVISADFSIKTSPVSHIEDLLQGLEMLAEKAGKQAVMFIDEFQDILKIDGSDRIQAAIRSVAQHSKKITYIFSGSSRTMLEKIFNDSNKPLYMMCQKICLGRIKAHKLSKHIQTAWSMSNKGPVGDQAISKILTLTECHTYYVNALCSRLLQRDETPDEATVESVWDCVLADERDKIVAELQNLSSNQRKILTAVALMGEVNAPNSQEFLNDVQLPLSSAQRAIESLISNDYLFQEDPDGLKLIDPLMKLFLFKRFEG